MSLSGKFDIHPKLIGAKLVSKSALDSGETHYRVVAAWLSTESGATKLEVLAYALATGYTRSFHLPHPNIQLLDIQ